jgi:hypothetical protein
MPLGAGPVGSPDWRRIVDWDGPAVWEILTKAITGEANSGVSDCSRYGYLAGRAFVTGEAFQLRIEWFSDQAATKGLGQWVMVLNPSVSNPAQLRIPHMGPFVRVVLEGKEGTSKCTATVRLFHSNRIHPLQLIPVNSVLMHNTHLYPEKGLSTISPTDYFAGPCEVEYESDVAGATPVLIESEVGPGIFITTALLRFPNTQPSGQAKVILPAGSWRVTAVNEAGERHININITAALTGSS